MYLLSVCSQFKHNQHVLLGDLYIGTAVVGSTEHGSEMVSSSELKLQRALSSGELFGGEDQSAVSRNLTNGGVQVSSKIGNLCDVNSNVEPAWATVPRWKSLKELNDDENKEKVLRKSQTNKFWHLFGKRGKLGFSKYLTSGSYKMSCPQSNGFDQDSCTEDCISGRYSDSRQRKDTRSSNDLREGFSRLTSRDSGFSSGIDSLPSTRPASLNGDRIPGQTGLHNLGNTCYINSVLQCLGHIDPFVEYFVMKRFTANTLSKRKGSKCELHSLSDVTTKLSQILKGLWSFGEYTKELCMEFKDAVSKSDDQFSGSMQHDAQEFLLWLLNVVHEDLGRSGKKRGFKTPSVKRKKHYSEEELALMTLATYSHSTGSFIQDLFQAQYRSSLNCPRCEKHSSTFDPFLCISLPIPQPPTKPFYVTVVFSGKYKDALQIGISVPTSGTVMDMKTQIHQLVKIKEENLVLLKIQDNGEQQCLEESSPALVANMVDGTFFAIEKPEVNVQKSERGDNSGEKTPADLQTSSVLVIVTNVEAKSFYYKRRFGNPIALWVPSDVSFKDLNLMVRREMKIEIREAFNREARRSKLAVGFWVAEYTSQKEYLSADTNFPLAVPSVQRSESRSTAAGFNHLRLVAEWEVVGEEWCFSIYGRGSVRIDPSVKLVNEEHFKEEVLNLQQCIDLHTQEEELQYEDFWKCPNCKTELQKATKTLSLWSLPDVLVFHLKRFQHGSSWKRKISSIVDFPLEGLDMSSHIVQRKKLSPKSIRRHSSLKKLRYQPPPTQEDCVYDLIAVCNHHGPIVTSGHYTAHCKNSLDGNWYHFDDLAARPVPKEQVLSKNAYLLFYQRRTGLSRAASVASFPVTAKHWSLKIPVVSQREVVHFDVETSNGMAAKQEFKSSIS